jgi:hypothetical protein
MMFPMNDDAGAEKTDAGQNSLNDPAGGIGNCRGIAVGQHRHRCGGEAHQSKRSQADRFVMQITVEADGAAGKRGDTEPQHDFRPVKQGDLLCPASTWADVPSYKIRRSGACR